MTWKQTMPSLLRGARDIAVMALVIFGARSAIADWNNVPTGSMKPTILEGDFIFVNRLAYDLKLPFTTVHLAEWSRPRRGDIVVLRSPVNGDRLVKRVVGIPGDRVALVGNVLFINGDRARYEPLDPAISSTVSAEEREKYRFAWEQFGLTRHPVMALANSGRGDFGPVQVPDGAYLVLGDNRDNSADSRYIGFVPRDLILGRATTVIASWQGAGLRDKRILRPLQ